MDIRVLRYYLTVAREESFSKAAEVLYLSQPTLSRQIREMEEELGVQLLIRTNRNVQLTPEGQRLRRRAQEIVDLMDKTQDEFQHLDDEVSGQITIGAGETQIMREIAKVAIPLQREHPGIRFNLYSTNAAVPFIPYPAGTAVQLCGMAGTIAEADALDPAIEGDVLANPIHHLVNPVSLCPR